MESLRDNSSVKKPSYTMRMGTNSVRLRFPNSPAALTAPRVPGGPGSLRAVFKLDVDKSFTKEELDKFCKWIQSLSPSVGLTLTGVYETKSMCLIFESRYAIFLKLDGLPSVQLICETRGGNRLLGTANPAVLASSSNVHRPASGAENVRPKK